MDRYEGKRVMICSNFRCKWIGWEGQVEEKIHLFDHVSVCPICKNDDLICKKLTEEWDYR